MSPAQLNEALTRHLLGFEDTKNIIGTSNIIKPTGEVKPLRVHLNGNWDCPQCDRENDHFLNRCLDCNSSKYDQTANLNIKASSKRVRVIQSHSCPDCGWLHFHKNEECIGCGMINQEFRKNRINREAIQRVQNPTGLDKTLAEGMQMLMMNRKKKKIAAERALRPVPEDMSEQVEEMDPDAPPPPPGSPDRTPSQSPPGSPKQLLGLPPPPPDALGVVWEKANGVVVPSNRKGSDSDEETKHQSQPMVVRRPVRGTPTHSDAEDSDFSSSSEPDFQVAADQRGALDLFNPPEVEDSDSDDELPPPPRR